VLGILKALPGPAIADEGNWPLTRPKNLIDFESMRPTLTTILTAFLLAASAQAQDLPDGAGKDLVVKVCTVCHDSARIVSKKWTRAEWNDTVDKMAMRGAMASDDEFDAIVTYLTKNFGKDPSAEKSN
jgi:cytochrome c5